MSKIGSILGTPEDSRTFKKDNCPWLLKDQLIGVEVEVEGCRSTTGLDTNLWEIKEDNSLRDNGREFTTRGGLFGNDLDAACRNIMETAERNRWKISERTGLHIHMDCRSLEHKEFALLCLLYALVERPLFRFIGDDRDTNVHCAPWFAAEHDLKHISAMMINENQETWEASIKIIQRYSALNLAALSKFSTIEFRHMKTTFDPTRLRFWINVIMSLRKFAVDFMANHESLDELLMCFSGEGPTRFFQQVFQEYSEPLVYPEMERDLWAGITISQDLLYMYKNRFVAMFPDEELQTGEAPFFSKFKEKFKKTGTAPPQPARMDIEADQAIERVREQMRGARLNPFIAPRRGIR